MWGILEAKTPAQRRRLPMSILPQFALTLNLLQVSVEALLQWFSDGVYASLLARAGNHWLLQLPQRFDFTPLEQVGASFPHDQGPGAPPPPPVPRLVRALLVWYLFNWSLGELEWAILF